MRPRSVKARDTRIILSSRVNSWLIAGASAVSGVCSLVAARAFFGPTLRTGSDLSAASCTPLQSQSSSDCDGTGLAACSSPRRNRQQRGRSQSGGLRGSR
jgi:hypothetical protein